MLIQVVLLHGLVSGGEKKGDVFRSLQAFWCDCDVRNSVLFQLPAI